MNTSWNLRWPMEQDLRAAFEIARRYAFVQSIPKLFPLFILGVLWELDSSRLQAMVRELGVDIERFTRELGNAITAVASTPGGRGSGSKRWSKRLSGIKNYCWSNNRASKLGQASEDENHIELNKLCHKVLDKALEIEEMAREEGGGFARGHSSSYRRMRPSMGSSCDARWVDSNEKEPKKGFRVLPRFQVWNSLAEEGDRKVKVSRYGFIIALLYVDSGFQSILKAVKVSPTVFENAVRASAAVDETDGGMRWHAELGGLAWFVRDLSKEDTGERNGASVVGREDEFARIVGLLRDPARPSIALVGEHGVGKSAIIEALAIKLSRQHKWASTRPSGRQGSLSSDSETVNDKEHDTSDAANCGISQSSHTLDSDQASTRSRPSSALSPTTTTEVDAAAAAGTPWLVQFDISLFLSTLPSKNAIYLALNTLSDLCQNRNALIVIDPLDLVLGHRSNSNHNNSSSKLRVGPYLGPSSLLLNQQRDYGFTTFRQHIKYLIASGKVRVLGGVAPPVHHRFATNDSHFASEFIRAVYIDSLPAGDTVRVLEHKRGDLEAAHDVKVDPDVLPILVNLAQRYHPYPVFPATALGLFEEVCRNAKFDMYYWMYWLGELETCQVQMQWNHRLLRWLGRASHNSDNSTAVGSSSGGGHRLSIGSASQCESLGPRSTLLPLVGGGAASQSRHHISKRDFSRAITEILEKYQPWLDANAHRVRFYTHLFSTSPDRLKSCDLELQKAIRHVYRDTRGEHCPLTSQSSYPPGRFTLPSPVDLGRVTVNSVLLDSRILAGTPIPERLRASEGPQLESLESLESTLKSTIYAQNAAVEHIMDIIGSAFGGGVSNLRRLTNTSRATLHSSHSRSSSISNGGTCGIPPPAVPSAVFVGPKGTGKTFLAQTLAGDKVRLLPNFIVVPPEAFYAPQSPHPRSSTDDIVRADDHHLLRQLPDSVLADPVRARPFSIVLIQGVSNAHPEVQQAFADVLATGFLTDSSSRRVDFRNTFVIFEISVTQHQLNRSSILPLSPSRTSLSHSSLSLSLTDINNSNGNSDAPRVRNISRPSLSSLIASPLLSSLKPRNRTSMITQNIPSFKPPPQYASYQPPPLPPSSVATLACSSGNNSSGNQHGTIIPKSILPELIKQVTGVVNFAPLFPKNIHPIVRNLIASLSARRNIQLIMEPGVYDFIIDQSFDSTLGMFSVDRFITQHIDVPLGKLRDSGAVRPGGAVCVYCDLGSETGLNLQVLISSAVNNGIGRCSSSFNSNDTRYSGSISSNSNNSHSATSTVNSAGGIIGGYGSKGVSKSMEYDNNGPRPPRLRLSFADQAQQLQLQRQEHHRYSIFRFRY